MTFQEFLKQECGYDCITTFWDDFSIADRFGLAAVKDTFKRAFNEWKTNYKYLTELALVLNNRSWFHHNNNRRLLSDLYVELYRKADDWAKENLKGEEAEYYFRILD